MADQIHRPDRREYTLMLVPHDGNDVRKVRIPIQLIKYALVSLCVITVVLVGVFAQYHSAVAMSREEKAELDKLRQLNGDQVRQIEQLTQTTASLQSDMERLNSLEVEVRCLLNGEESTETSRAGLIRPSQTYNGQGGPVIRPQVSEIASLVDQLQVQAKEREQSLEYLRDALVERKARMNATPSIWPAGGDVTSRFGWRSSPWGGSSDWHPGIDIANGGGTPIVATAEGVVAYSGWYGGYGRLVQIDHGNGIETLYGHNSEIIVSVGQRVKKGQTIAYMGSTGYSTGTHVHYEIRVNGTAVNPAGFL